MPNSPPLSEPAYTVVQKLILTLHLLCGLVLSNFWLANTAYASSDIQFSGTLSKSVSSRRSHYFSVDETKQYKISLDWNSDANANVVISRRIGGKSIVVLNDSMTGERSERGQTQLSKGEQLTATVWVSPRGDVDYVLSIEDVGGEPPVESADRLAVFPEACGYGANPRNWRDARIIHVTNLNDSGAGSLRQALLSTGKRIIVFDVGGTIHWRNIVLMSRKHSNVYVAGQTAPGDGIQIIGADNGHGLRIRGDENGPVRDVIIRNISLRGQKGSAATGDPLAIQTVVDSYFANVSTAFSSDEILGQNALSCDYPQWSGGIQQRVGHFKNLFAEPLQPHTTTALIAGLPMMGKQGNCSSGDFVNYLSPPANPASGYVYPQGARIHAPQASTSLETQKELTFHRTVFSSGTHRQPSQGGVKVHHTNNISYGHSLFSFMPLASAQIDNVGQFVLVHPETTQEQEYSIFAYQGNNWTSGSRFDLNNPDNYYGQLASVYMNDTYVESSPRNGSIINPWQADNTGQPVYWTDRLGFGSQGKYNNSEMIDGNYVCERPDWRCALNIKRAQPLVNSSGSEASPYACSAQTPSESLEAEILSDVGNSWSLDCAGNKVSRRQQTDQRQVDNITNRTDSIGGARAIGTQGDITYPQHYSISPQTVAEVGGYDTLSSGSTCPDMDADGMPDAFERKHGLNHQNADDQWLDPDGDGYTNLEEYLNGSKPQ